MTNLKDLKNIADIELSNITVSNELKERTLKRMNKKRVLWPQKVIIPAVCAGAIIITVASQGVFNPGSKQIPQVNGGNIGISTMAATDNKDNTAVSDSTFSPGVQVLESWKIDKMEDAKQYMDGTVVIPSYIPEGYKTKEIMAAGPTAGDAINVTMEFERDDRTFSISQDKGVAKKMDLKNSKKVDIYGTEGYINSNKFGDEGNPIYSTDLKWYKGDNLYMVQGSISEEEAIKVARSLK